MIRRIIIPIMACTFFSVWVPGLAIGGDDTREVLVKKVVGEEIAKRNGKIILEIENPEILKEQAKKLNKEIVPFIDGQPLKDVYVRWKDSNTLWFYLGPEKESNDFEQIWSELVKHREEVFSTSTKVSLSIGLMGSEPVPTKLKEFNIKIINDFWLNISSVIILLLLGIFIWLANKSNIIRDSGEEPGGDARKPFSIGRTQMAIWFFLAIGSYPFLWLITNGSVLIPESILGLIGISAGTALGATVIDVGKHNSSIADKEKLSAEKVVLETRIKELKIATNASLEAPNLNALRSELESSTLRVAEIEQKIPKLSIADKGGESKGFFRDVISDANGVSFHRFQIFAWTIVLGVIFVAEVVENLKMPEFSGALLALMGVSSGTYIGFKLPDQKHQKAG